MEKTITAIEAQKRNRSRVNIHLDGVYAFSLDRLMAAWLRPGRKLNEQQIAQLLAKDEQESAYNRALHFLSFRTRSEKEVQTYLHQKDYSADVIEAVLRQLKEEGFLDDIRFSREWVENRAAFRPRSQWLLSRELQQKGIPQNTAEAAVSDAGLDDSQLAMQAARRAASRYAELPWKEFLPKLGAYLQRRGFSASVARETARQCWTEMQDSRTHQNTEQREME